MKTMLMALTLLGLTGCSGLTVNWDFDSQIRYRSTPSLIEQFQQK
jgi:hypothetical protein